MKQYRDLIFDADYTLVNYKQDEIAALKKLYDEIGYTYDDRVLERTHRFSEQAWEEAGLYEVHRADVQKRYHQLYWSHVDEMFKMEFALTGFEYSPQQAAKKLMENLTADGHFLDGAQQTVQELSRRGYRVCVATNGIIQMQKGRLRPILPFVYKLFISEAIGTIKPNAAFYQEMLRQLNATADECLMIGDSLYSDIAGANGIGMDSCWFDTRKMERADNIRPTYHIESLTNLLTMLP